MVNREGDIAGYDYATERTPPSPVSTDDLRALLQTVEFTEIDRRYLTMLGDALRDHAEQLVDLWRAKIGAQAHLAQWFFNAEGQPNERYKAAVKRRFVQWVSDICTRPFDRAWLDYQDEIGRRHTPEKKNVTDDVTGPRVVPLRYVIAFSAVITTSIREFLEQKGHSAHDITRMADAWSKAVLLTIALWSRAYTRDGLW